MSKRAIILTSVAVALVGAGTAAFVRRDSARKDQPRFTTVAVDKGRIAARVTASGTVSALVTVQVGSQVSGRIKALHADFNSQVKKGDLLATIDPQIFEATLEQARANAAAASSDLSAARIKAADGERQYERTRSLAERNLIAQAELDAAQVAMEAGRAAVASAQSRVAQNRAQLHQAQINLAYTKIHSPIDGVVISRSVDVGQTVAASLQAPTLFLLAEDLRKMQIDTSVAEADIGKLHPGMSAVFTVDAFPNERFTGSVRQIRNAPQTVQNVVTYDAVIDVANPELKLRPGMTATVTFLYAERDDVLRVPNAALRFRPPSEILASLGASEGTKTNGSQARGGAGKEGQGRGGDTPNKRRVWMLANGQPQLVPVTTGVSDGSLTEVASDRLREGDQVIIDVESEKEAPPTAPAAAPSGGPRAFRRIF
jgi:HlyD family secretion protein